ncbi:MAG TPA: universal stress protein, partial [Pirellulaceae bacterium]|nr:universal stress protein [Pirellulaceae bacterium]
GHRRLRSGRRSLARRLAMLGPMAVWMVPEGSPIHISKILAPTDFSEHAAESVAMAVTIARHAGLSCCRALHVAFDASTIRYDEHIAEWAGNEQRSMNEFLKRVDTQGIDIHPMFRESINVGQAIVRAAQDINADLLVMNTRGRSRAAAILLGSATSQTMTDCQIPILVIKNHGSHMTVFEALRESRFWRQPDAKTN